MPENEPATAREIEALRRLAEAVVDYDFDSDDDFSGYAAVHGALVDVLRAQGRAGPDARDRSLTPEELEHGLSIAERMAPPCEACNAREVYSADVAREADRLLGALPWEDSRGVQLQAAARDLVRRLLGQIEHARAVATASTMTATGADVAHCEPDAPGGEPVGDRLDSTSTTTATDRATADECIRIAEGVLASFAKHGEPFGANAVSGARAVLQGIRARFGTEGGR